MVAVAFLVVWSGYTLLAYGLSQVRGCNASLSSIALPGKFSGCSPDQAPSSAAPGQTAGNTSDAFKSVVNRLQRVLANPKSTDAQKQAALQNVANVGAKT